MAEEIGIVACGAYIPQMRLRRSAIFAANAWAMPGLKGQSRGERAVANWDEDVITMAVEAGRIASSAASVSSIGSLVLASTSAPFADRSNAGLVAGALGLNEGVLSLDVSGTMRAGVSALIAGARLAQSGSDQVLVAAAEVRNAKPGSLTELQSGDAAAAVLLGRENVIARIVASHTLTRDFVDHFRASSSKHDYGWEERWVRDEGYMKIVPAAVAGLLAKAELTASDIGHFVLPTPLIGLAALMARRLKIADVAVADGLNDRCGYAGAAHALVMLARVLETAQPGERILVGGFGNGCDAILLETTEAIADFRPRRTVDDSLAVGRSIDDYMRYLSFRGEIDMDWGARAEFGVKYALTAEYRSSAANLAFIGGRDRQTGNIQFPKTPMGIAEGATGIAEYDDVPMADEPARIVSFTADWLTYYPSPPLNFGLVQFDNGARVMMEVVDAPEGSLHVGTPLKMVFRIKEIDHGRGYRHYFWKGAPILGQVALAEAAQ